jgi:transcription initiation factor TFIID subunit 13
MEPRARPGRHKSSLNFERELRTFLYAYGAPTHPDLLDPHPDSAQYLARLPTANKNHAPSSFTEPYKETVRVLDEIVTDFIIETCHEATAHASLVGRQKLNVNDFKYVVHKDKAKLGRVQSMLAKEATIKKNKRDVDGMAGEGQKPKVDELQFLGDYAGEEGTGKGKGRGRGRRRKRQAESQEPEAGSDKDGKSEVRSRGGKRARSDVG